MITSGIILFTAVISYIAFRKPEIMRKYDFAPYYISQNKEYHRFFTHAFLHADWPHLIINMLVLFSFGSHVENIFNYYTKAGYFQYPSASFIILYFGGVIVSTLTTFFKNRSNRDYIAVGASGAVSAVVFTSIFFSPFGKILFFGILPIPGILFGILYLFYSSYMSRRGSDNINHDAHFWGAVYGFLFPVLLNPSLFKIFLNQLNL
jgi:membrane associated rhomboid family serine protease